MIPGLLQHGDVAEIGSLIASHHGFWEVGSRDRPISPRWAQTALDRLGPGSEPALVNEVFLICQCVRPIAQPIASEHQECLSLEKGNKAKQ